MSKAWRLIGDSEPVGQSSFKSFQTPRTMDYQELCPVYDSRQSCHTWGTDLPTCEAQAGGWIGERATCRSRLQTVAPLIKNGTVLFPRAGCEELLGQVFNLGVESRDDLCDGITTPLQGLMSLGLQLPKIHWIDG